MRYMINKLENVRKVVYDEWMLLSCCGAGVLIVFGSRCKKFNFLEIVHYT